MDQFENPGLIELRRLREEPPSHARLSSSSESNFLPPRVQTDGNRRAPGLGGMVGAPRPPNRIPAIFDELGETHAGERCRAEVECVDLSHCACCEWNGAV
ncbi:hypothetical protein AVEN_20340-1 [Araneus ventricosus]|uniref:Uncharacterized protein n=1 Tax=Araneus ventricosus TaxID=182803 RepID=A0A4Y2IP39_ARAVE|nr:hypothetical protein AVEN_20340-1 [Araneus ventricosus]